MISTVLRISQRGPPVRYRARIVVARLPCFEPLVQAFARRLRFSTQKIETPFVVIKSINGLAAVRGERNYICYQCMYPCMYQWASMKRGEVIVDVVDVQEEKRAPRGNQPLWSGSAPRVMSWKTLLRDIPEISPGPTGSHLVPDLSR